MNQPRRPPHRIGLVVPSSDVTVETEVPALPARHTERFSFHSSRMRMHRVPPEEPAAYTLLTHLGLEPVLPGAGRLLAAPS
jgi:maleate isomerase